MKNNKLFQRIVLWRLLGRNKVLYRFDGDKMGGFRVIIRRHRLDIYTISDNFHMRLMVGTHPYGYLLSSAQQGIVDNIKGYCVYMYQIAMCMTTDKEFVGDITKSLNKYEARLENQAKNSPKANDFEHDLALREVRQNVERGQMTRQQRRKAERDAQKKLKSALREIESEEAKKGSDKEQTESRID